MRLEDSDLAQFTAGEPVRWVSLNDAVKEPGTGLYASLASNHEARCRIFDSWCRLLDAAGIRFKGHKGASFAMELPDGKIIKVCNRNRVESMYGLRVTAFLL